MMIPYCGTPPDPSELWRRWNLDPVLIAVLLGSLIVQVRSAASRQSRALAVAGWLVAGAALLSPLCALSVALFSARIAQHMILVLVAAPLIAIALPVLPRSSARLWWSAGIFFIALWFWHMPVPYDTTFRSTWVYWAMHASLFGSALVLWRELLQHSTSQTGASLLAGGLTSMHMGLLGAVLTFAGHPLFYWHLTTAPLWEFTPLQDQQLGGVLMWVPGIVLFLFAALRSMSRLYATLHDERTA